MTLQELRCFLTVAETLNYTRAAELLYITQPSVSRYISNLEEELGTPLLDRTVRRKIELTPAGRILKDSLTRCRDDLDGALRQIQEYSRTIPVRMDVAESTSIPRDVMLRFDRFQQDAAPATVDLRFTPYDALKTDLEKGAIIVVSRELTDTLRTANTYRLTRTSIHYVLLFSSQHEAVKKADRSGQAIECRDLAGSPLFLPKTLPLHVQKHYLQELGQATGTRPDLLLLESYQMVFTLLQAGRGCTICDTWSSGLTQPDLTYLTLPETTDYYLAWDPLKANIQAVRKLLSEFD